MGEIRYDSYHKFLSSLGIALIVVSAGMLVYCFLNYRLIFDSLANWFPYIDWVNMSGVPNAVVVLLLLLFAISITAVGTWLLWEGSRPWKKLQLDLDKRQMAETDQIVSQRSPGDYAKEKEKSDDINSSFSERESEFLHTEDQRVRCSKSTDEAEIRSRFQKQYLCIEEKALDYVESWIEKDYGLFRRARIARRIECDALAISSSGVLPDIIYEIKQSSAAMAGDRIRQVCSKLQERDITAYKRKTGRDCRAELLLIVADMQFEAVDRTRAAIQPELGDSVLIRILRKEDFDR